jgi:hypothetical protein
MLKKEDVMSNMNTNQSSKEVTRDYDLNIAYTGYNEAENGKSKTQFSLNQIEEFNSFCIKNFDKWNRMYQGISSSLTLYKDNVMHIEVNNSEIKVDSTKQLAIEFAEQWKEHVRRYTSLMPEAFVVYLYSTNRLPGFTCNKDTSKEEKERLVAATKVKETKKIVGILSGLFVRREK